MKTNLLPLAAVVIVVMSAIGVAGPLNKTQVSAGAQWVFHADLETFSTSQMGQLVLGEVARHHQAKVNALKQLLGTDLMADLYGFTVFGPDGNEANAVAIIHGKFDRSKLLALLALNPAYAESAYGATTLYHWQEEMRGKKQVGTFAADDLIVIGQTEATVKTALDVLDGRGTSLAANRTGALWGLTEGLDGAILSVAAVGLSELTGDNEHAAVLKNSRMLAIIADEAEGDMQLFVQLEANSVEAAQQVEQVARGMLAFASLQVQNQPALLPLIQACHLTRTDAQIALSFRYSSAALFGLAKSHVPVPAF